jgi:hypothetical protein
VPGGSSRRRLLRGGDFLTCGCERELFDCWHRVLLSVAFDDDDGDDFGDDVEPRNDTRG